MPKACEGDAKSLLLELMLNAGPNQMSWAKELVTVTQWPAILFTYPPHLGVPGALYIAIKLILGVCEKLQNIIQADCVLKVSNLKLKKMFVEEKEEVGKKETCRKT